MRSSAAVFAALALGACGASPWPRGGALIAEIPSAFHGSWSIDPAHCNFEGDTLDNEFFVSSDTVGFHAETHRVRKVGKIEDGVKVDYFAAADASRQPPVALVLSPDGSMLNDLWHRCPGRVEK